MRVNRPDWRFRESLGSVHQRKWEEVYLKAYQDGTDARGRLSDYFRFYNVESLTLNTMKAAELNLNIAPILS